MYRLMKSEKRLHGNKAVESVLDYSQYHVAHFELLLPALSACDAANDKGGPRHYVLDASGKEYYRGSWIF